MTDATESPDRIEAQLILMRAEAANAAAQAAKAEKEARYYPAIAILTAIIGSAGVWGVVAAITAAATVLVAKALHL